MQSLRSLVSQSDSPFWQHQVWNTCICRTETDNEIPSSQLFAIILFICHVYKCVKILLVRCVVMIIPV